MNTVNTVIGIDASLQATGSAILSHGSDNFRAWTHRPPKGCVDAARLVWHKAQLARILDRYRPGLAVLEGYSYGSSGRVFELGELGGVVKVELAERNIETLIVAPARLKRFLGVVRPEKSLVIAAVKQRYGFVVDPGEDDQADAAGLAMLGRVYLTGLSEYRSELEVIRDMRAESLLGKTKKTTFKRAVSV